MLYITLTLTAKTPAELQHRVGRLASYAQKFIETEPKHATVKLHGNDHGNIYFTSELQRNDPLKLRDAAPQLLAAVRKIIQNCYDPELRLCDTDPQRSLLGVRMTMRDLRDAAAAIHAATDVVVGIPNTLPDQEQS